MTVCVDDYREVLFNAFRSLHLDSIILYKDSIVLSQQNALNDCKDAIEKGKQIEESYQKDVELLEKENKKLNRTALLYRIGIGILAVTTLILAI